MSTAGLAPVPSPSQTCANCSAPLVSDQRYCLSCGRPCSPVRLAFLDVLESERAPELGPGAPGAPAGAYLAYPQPAAGPAWLRRYAPMFAVTSVLLLAMIVGLLVGHWVTQGKAPSGPQLIKVEGLGAAPLAASGGASAATGATAGAGSSPASAAAAKSGSSSKKEEEAEKAEAKAEEKAEEKAPAKAPPAKKLSSTAVSKLESTTGKKHEAELNKLSTAPIEVK